MDQTDIAALKVQQIVDAIKPLLGGHPPEMQGAVIADLLAIWLASHAPELRETALTFHIDMVRLLTAAEEGLMFGSDGHPARRQT
jgi:hypothetical protein